VLEVLAVSATMHTAYLGATSQNLFDVRQYLNKLEENIDSFVAYYSKEINSE